MKAITLVPLFLLILATACSKTDGPVIPICTATADLQAIQGSSYNLNFKRNSKNLVTRIDYTVNASAFVCTVAYDGSDRVTGIIDGLQSSTYEYDGQQLLVMNILSRPDTLSDFSLQVRLTYHYDEEGRIDTVYNGTGYRRFEYDVNGNVTKTYNSPTGSSEKLESENLTFDDKPNALSSAHFNQLALLTVSSQPWITVVTVPWVSVHNVTTANVVTSGGSVIAKTYTYTYNSSGYPVSCLEREEQYTYVCQ